MAKVCFRCGTPVEKEQEVSDYPYYCPECDENLYEIETKEADTRKEVE